MISVVMLAYNNEDIIEQTLTVLKEFDEVILVDTKSTDNTVKIAKKFPNVKVFSKALDNFGKTRNFGSTQAKNDWILALDTDEVLSEELNHFLKRIPLDIDSVYNISFRNFYKGRWIKSCGWHPESHIRLYNRKKTKFSEDFIHEKVLSKNLKVQKILHPIFHYSYRSLDDFLIKMKKYSSLFAKQNQGKKSSSVFKALTHAGFAFFKSYILKRGFLEKSSGFIISIYQANTAFYKYLKLKEANENVFNSSISSRK